MFLNSQFVVLVEQHVTLQWRNLHLQILEDSAAWLHLACLT